MQRYTLPDLPYDYSALEPHYSGKVLELHHGKHHAAYVSGANATLDKLAEAREKEGFRGSTACAPSTSCCRSPVAAGVPYGFEVTRDSSRLKAAPPGNDRRRLAAFSDRTDDPCGAPQPAGRMR
jgi:hypothetical protein